MFANDRGNWKAGRRWFAQLWSAVQAFCLLGCQKYDQIIGNGAYWYTGYPARIRLSVFGTGGWKRQEMGQNTIARSGWPLSNPIQQLVFIELGRCVWTTSRSCHAERIIDAVQYASGKFTWWAGAIHCDGQRIQRGDWFVRYQICSYFWTTNDDGGPKTGDW